LPHPADLDIPALETCPASIAFLTSVLRGEATSWPAGASRQEADAFVAHAIDQSVEALVVWRLGENPDPSWPDAVRMTLSRIAREEAMLEAGREPELRRLLDALQAAGVKALLFKGAALAYAHYPEAWLRPRNDNDILVPAADADAADQVLTCLGYERANALEGELVSYQAPYVRVDRIGVKHVVDLHWKISNRPRIAEVLPFDDLWSERRPVAALGPNAHAPCDRHALTLACLHSVAHHRNSDNLVWCYDIHLLAGQLRDDDWQLVSQHARRCEVAAICANGLRRAVVNFRTPVPHGLLDELTVRGEFSEPFLSAEPWRGDVRLSDLGALDGWGAKLRFVREVAFPSSDFMLREYASSTRALIPVLHLHRLSRGTWRLVRRFFA
jgi:hypothetical protein